MKKSKMIIAAIVAIILTVALCASACVTEADTQINDAFKLISDNDYLKVEVSDKSGVFYVYDNGKVTDVYGLGIKFEDVVGAKGKAYLLTTENLKEGYVCEKNESSGKISLSGELQKTGTLGLDGATVVLKANTVTKEISSCVISYTDENGYKIKITLA